MKSFARGSLLVVSALALTSACGGYSVPYEGARGAKRAKTDVPVYEVQCQPQVNSPADCTYQGGPMGFKVTGLFRVPPKALANWGRYRVRVIETAAGYGCPAIALRATPPAASDGTAVGAFCIDPSAAASGPTEGNGGGGVGVSVTATATVTPPTIECNQQSDCPPGLNCSRGTCVP